MTIAQLVALIRGEDLSPALPIAEDGIGDLPQRLAVPRGVPGAAFGVVLDQLRRVADDQQPAGEDLAGLLERAAMRLWPIAVVGVDLLPPVGITEVAVAQVGQRLTTPNDVHDVARLQICRNCATRGCGRGGRCEGLTLGRGVLAVVDLCGEWCSHGYRRARRHHGHANQ